jgi:flagellum-specific ATP synthase
MIHIGAYVKGSDPKIDFAIEHIDALHSVLRQAPGERGPLDESRLRLAEAIGG